MSTLSIVAIVTVSFLVWWFLGIISSVLTKIRINNTKCRRYYSTIDKETADRYKLTLNDIYTEICIGWLWGALGFIAVLIVYIATAIELWYANKTHGYSVWNHIIWRPAISYKNQEEN